MGNWFDHELAVVGAPKDIDRWCELAITGNFAPDHTLADEPTIHFDRICPYARGEAAIRADEHQEGVVITFWRTRTQAHVTILTKNAVPEHFYQVRMAREWPGLSFCCAINDEDRWFGGLYLCIRGELTNEVRAYDEHYDRRKHRYRIRKLVARWQEFVEAGRPWRVMVPFRPEKRWSLGVDATLDSAGTRFNFRTEAACRRFAARQEKCLVEQVGSSPGA